MASARRVTAVLTSSLALILAVGCESTADRQRKADEARAEADQKAAMAQQQAQQQSAAAQNAAQQQATVDQQRADQVQNAATGELMKEGAAYTAKLTLALQEMNGKLNDLHSAGSAETDPQKRVEDDQVFEQLVARREALAADARALPQASTMSWPDLKAKIDRDLDDARPALRSASAHIKRSPR
jgi:hypothetical protein